VIYPTEPTAPEPAGQAAINWSKVFPGTREQVGKARRFLAAILEGRSAADDAALCLSELASNACLHSWSGKPGGQFTVRAELSTKGLRVEVRDGGGPWLWPAETDERGRGLLIIGSLARAWGRAGDRERGWTVWFEMDTR
jgi:anti-sigma regulatory factor (Ser/Thr protein kinase)